MLSNNGRSGECECETVSDTVHMSTIPIDRSRTGKKGGPKTPTSTNHFETDYRHWTPKAEHINDSSMLPALLVYSFSPSHPYSVTVTVLVPVHSNDSLTSIFDPKAVGLPMHTCRDMRSKKSSPWQAEHEYSFAVSGVFKRL